MRIASEVLRPHVVSFLDLMLKDKHRTLRIEEIEVPECSAWLGKRLSEVNFRGAYNLLPLALKDAFHDGQQHGFWVNPPENVSVHSGLVVIVLGDAKDVHRAREDAGQLTQVAVMSQ
jgi:voltage-gated potassium channel